MAQLATGVCWMAAGRGLHDGPAELSGGRSIGPALRTHTPEAQWAIRDQIKWLREIADDVS
jgi:hypothetical protein